MQTIYLDISNKGVIPCIQAKQSEVGRKFLAVITDNGVPYNIPLDTLISVWYEGSMDAGNYSSINEKSAFTIDGNKVAVELVAQMLMKPGDGDLCLSLSSANGNEINTWNIPYHVEYKPGAGSHVPTEYYTALTEAAAEAATVLGDARSYAERAEAAAEVAVNSAALRRFYEKDFTWEDGVSFHYAKTKIPKMWAVTVQVDIEESKLNTETLGEWKQTFVFDWYSPNGSYFAYIGEQKYLLCRYNPNYSDTEVEFAALTYDFGEGVSNPTGSFNARIRRVVGYV